MEVLRVEDLHKTYRKGFIPKSYPVLKGINFSIKAGTITGFLGANGAGKTTTMKCILGLNHFHQGKITFFGGQSLDNEVKKKIGYLPERPYFYEYLTGDEFLQFYGELSLRIPKNELKTRIDTLLKRVDLLHARDKQLRDYSKGMIQKIGIAQALIHNPELLILDEPMSGLDPDGRHALRDIILETAKQGTAVFFSSHLLPDAETLCESIVMIKGGKVIYEGKTLELLNSLSEGFEVTYIKEGKLLTSKVATQVLLQAEIDRLRKEKHEVTIVRPLRANLEEAFVNMALRG